MTLKDKQIERGEAGRTKERNCIVSPVEVEMFEVLRVSTCWLTEGFV